MNKLFCFSLVVFLCCSVHARGSESSFRDEKDSMNRLVDKIDTLELEFITWGCTCPNWITTSDYTRAVKYGNLISYCIFIESAKPGFELPDEFDPEKHLFRVIGQFYEKEAVPAYFIGEEEVPGKAKIFRFTTYELVEIKPEK